VYGSCWEGEVNVLCVQVGGKESKGRREGVEAVGPKRECVME